MSFAPFRHTLDNGATVILVPNRTIPAVSLVAGVRGGSALDPDGAEGTAALLARVLDRGTLHRSAAAIADDLDARGASMSVTAGRHLLTVTATCLADDLAPVVDIVADSLRAPSLLSEEVEVRRSELLTLLRQEHDDPASRAVDGLMEQLYPGHPYSRRGRGRIETVERLDREALLAAHTATFLPERTTVVLAGDLEPDEAFATVARALEDWQVASPTRAVEPVPDARPATDRALASIVMPDKAQTDVAYGFVGLRRADPEYLAAYVMNNALGQYGLGGRLGDNIRERQGMAYYAFSTLDAGLGPGPLTVRAGVSAANVERTLAAIDSEIAAVLRDGFSANEVAESKRYQILSLPRQLETNAAIAGFLLSTETLGLGMDYHAQLPGLLEQVTLEQVNAAARRLLDPAKATIVVAGPWTAPASA